MASITQQQSQSGKALQKSEYSFLRIINPEDYQKWRQSKEKIYIAPTVFFAGITALIFLGRRVQLGRLFANPLKNPGALQKSQNRWDFLIKHSVIFGTLAVAAGAYFKKEFNKYLIFKEYEKEVNFYMRWRVENQIIGFINEEKQLSNEDKIKLAGKVL